MDRVDDAGLVRGSPVTVARNQLVLIAKPDAEAPIIEIADLADAAVVALCGSDAPCGSLSDQVLDRAGVEVADDRVSRTPNARATLRAVSDGDADAALVYVTDALAVGDAVVATPLPLDLQVATTYPAAVVGASEPPASAERFVAFLQTPEARRILARHGFEAP